LELVSFTNYIGNDDDDDCFDLLLDDNDSVQYSGDLDKCLFADSEDEEDDDDILFAGEEEEYLEVLELVGDIKKSLKDASYKFMPSTKKLEESLTNMLSFPPPVKFTLDFEHTME
jgi:hypothetical protein